MLSRKQNSDHWDESYIVEAQEVFQKLGRTHRLVLSSSYATDVRIYFSLPSISSYDTETVSNTGQQTLILIPR
jgi:hypothetical protein